MTYEQLRLSNQLCFPMYAAARRIVGMYTPYLKPLGITYTQYLVLMVLWEDDGLRVGEICRRLYLDNGTLTPVLKSMESKGLLVRRRSEADERAVTVSLAPAGKAMEERAKDVPAEVGSCVPLADGDMRELYGLLYKFLGDGDGKRDRCRR